MTVGRASLAVAAVMAVIAPAALTQTSNQIKERCATRPAPILCQINVYRQGTWRFQTLLGVPHTPTVYSDRRSKSTAYRQWVRELWHDRYLEAKKAWESRPSYLSWWQWDALAQCETGGNWAMQGSTYSGGLGFHNGVWADYGGYQYAPNAGLATREEQIHIGYKLYQLYGWEPWGCAVNALGWS